MFESTNSKVVMVEQKFGPIAIIGASEKEDRYANMAQRLLMELGYSVVPISPKASSILGEKAYSSLALYPSAIDTVTLYIGTDRVDSVLDTLLVKKPRRVIFNPGTENAEVSYQLREAGIETIEACTLVLLRTGQF